MKMQFSVAFAAASGKAGDVVAARWKGRPYIRRRVIPANPQTALQRATRWAMKKLVKQFQGVSVDIKASWNDLADEALISMFNAFTKANMADEIATFLKLVCPANALVEPLGSLVAATGAGAPGDIDITWTAGGATAGDDVHIGYRKQGVTTPADVKTTAAYEFGYDEATGKVVSDLTFTISGLDAATDYNVWAWAGDAVNGNSLSLGDQATSKA